VRDVAAGRPNGLDLVGQQLAEPVLRYPIAAECTWEDTDWWAIALGREMILLCLALEPVGFRGSKALRGYH
jgi:hypothetical protein